MNKSILTAAITSTICTLVVLALYSSKFSPKQVMHEQYQEAKLVAENELLLSERLSKTYRTVSETNFISAAKEANLGVVYIEGEARITDDTYYTRNVAKSTGSGVIISNDGYIVTNAHVIENMGRIMITLNDRREYTAKVVGRDEQTDLALLKIEATNLPYLVFANSDSLLVGEWVLAIGNPFRMRSSVTAGIVSAKARNINILEQKGIESFIQTDAAVNPGNSGGALIDTRGNLVGINTAILSRGGSYEGFSFAIPANLARKVVRDLKEYGTVQRGWMGVTINNVNAQLAKSLDLPSIAGVFIDATTKDGAARAGGLKSTDVVTEINEVITNSVPEFMEQISKYSPGDKINVTYIRNGEKALASITLRNQLNTTDYVAVRKDKHITDLGFELRDLDSMEKSRYGRSGVYVVSVFTNSTIGKANVEPGYVITEYNGIEATDVSEFADWLQANDGTVVLKGFYENFPGEFPYTFEIQ